MVGGGDHCLKLHIFGIVVQEMGRLLERHKGQSEAITHMECVGIHELIVNHLFPLGHEQILECAQLINSKKENYDST